MAASFHMSLAWVLLQVKQLSEEQKEYVKKLTSPSELDIQETVGRAATSSSYISITAVKLVGPWPDRQSYHIVYVYICLAESGMAMSKQFTV